MLGRTIINGRFLILIYLAAFLMVSPACFKPGTAPPQVVTASPPPTPTSPGPGPAVYQLELIAAPREAADFVVNPKADQAGGYSAGTAVTIDVLPRAGWSVQQWAGPVYAIAGQTAKVSMDQDQTVVVQFQRAGSGGTPAPTVIPGPDPGPAYSLTVNRQRVTGPRVQLTSGAVQVEPGPDSPSNLYLEDTRVRLTAHPDEGFRFQGWEGHCQATETVCLLEMDQDQTVGVKFARPVDTYSLNIVAAPENGGDVSVRPAPNTDDGRYPEGTPVNLVAEPADDYLFRGWQGACSGTSNSCNLVMDSDQQVAALFQTIGELPSLSIGTIPEEGGQVRVSPAPNAPDGHYRVGTVVNLVAEPADGYEFRGWDGACSGTGETCRLTMNTSQAVFAGFVRNSDPPRVQPFTLTTSASPAAGGSVTPSGATNHPPGASVTVSYQLASGYQFDGWSGACTGVGVCTVTMDGNKSVVANFSQVIPQYSLTINCNGSGAVSRQGCNTVMRYQRGTQVNLTAAPSGGFAFDGWSGACVGTGSCLLTMDGDRSVTANFGAQEFELRINGQAVTVGTLQVNGGTIRIDPAPSPQTSKYAVGTTVTLTFEPLDGYALSCDANSLSMNADQSITCTSKIWWDSSFQWRQPVTVINPSAQTLNQGDNVTVSLNTSVLTGSGRLSSDCRDLRLVVNHTNSIAWYLDSNCNSTNTRLTFRITSPIPPGQDSGGAYYLYYGNPEAAHPNYSKSSVYYLYDNFDDNNFHSDRWETDPCKVGQDEYGELYFGNGRMELLGKATEPSYPSCTSTQYAMAWDFDQVFVTGNADRASVTGRSSSSSFELIRYQDSALPPNVRFTGGHWRMVLSGSQVSPTAEVWRDGVLVYTQTNIQPSAVTPNGFKIHLGMQNACVGGSCAEMTYYIDNVSILKGLVGTQAQLGTTEGK